MVRRAQQIVEQCIRRSRHRATAARSAHVQPGQPVRRILGPPCQQHQQRLACRQRHQRLDGGLALAVDPVQVLQQQDRRPRRDHLLDRVTYGIDDYAPPQQGFEIVPAGIPDGLVENGTEGSGPKIGMRRMPALRRTAAGPHGRCLPPAARSAAASSATHREPPAPADCPRPPEPASPSAAMRRRIHGPSGTFRCLPYPPARRSARLDRSPAPPARAGKSLRPGRRRRKARLVERARQRVSPLISTSS